MAAISADLQVMRQVYEELAGQERSTRQLIRELEQMSRGLWAAWQSDAIRELMRRVSKHTDSLEEQRRKLRSMMNVLEMVIGMYEECEGDLVDEAQGTAAQQTDVREQLIELILPSFGRGYIPIDWTDRIRVIDIGDPSAQES